MDKDKKKLDDQTPAKGKHLLMQTHVPPTLDDAAAKFTPVFETIIHFDDVTHRSAWLNVDAPAWFIRAERWQALSSTADGKTLYETREVFGGIGGYLVKWFFGKNLIPCFEAYAKALKARAEQA